MQAFRVPMVALAPAVTLANIKLYLELQPALTVKVAHIQDPHQLWCALIAMRARSLVLGPRVVPSVSLEL